MRTTFDIADSSELADWRANYSDFSQYVLEDVIIHNLFFEDSVRPSKFNLFIEKTASLTYSFIFWVAAFVSTLGAFFLLYFLMKVTDITQLPPNFREPLVFLPPLVIFVGLLAAREKIARTSLLAKKQFLEKKLDEQFWTNSKNLQLIPSSGNIRFCFGRQGFLVDGVNIQLKIDWNVFRSAEIAYIKIEISQAERGGTKATPYPRSEISDASHAIVFFPREPNQFSFEDQRGEFLVIPKRFFVSSKNSSTWQYFMKELSDKIATLAN